MSDTLVPIAALPATAAKPYALLALLQVHWFVRLRWVFMASALAALAVERFAVPTARRPWPVLVIVLGVAATNVLWSAIARRLRPQLENPRADQGRAIRNGQIFVSAQIATDLLLLTGILAWTGGAENPMSWFYLFHVAISGLLLRTWQAAIQGAWAILLYGGMCLAHLSGWLAYYPFLPQAGTSGLYALPTYVAAVIVINAVAIVGTLYFTDRIGSVLDRRADLLLKTNAALEQSRQAIHDLQHRRSRFMQTAAHQLKSPLAMAQTMASLVRDGVMNDPESVRATCERIARRCQEGSTQITELLALTRIRDGDPRRHSQARADVGRVVRELCAKYRAEAAQKPVAFDCRTPEEGELQARVDPTDLTDCLGALIENAIKFTPPGGSVLVTVTPGQRPPPARELPPLPAAIAQRGMADFVLVAVEDTGIGLGDVAEFLVDGTTTAGSMFDAFQRGDAAVAAGIPGAGLGLSIVREVLEQAGGYIHVRSRPGAGSTFTVLLPVAEQRAGVAEQPAAAT